MNTTSSTAVLAVDIGGTTTKIAAVSPAGDLLLSDALPTAQQGAPETFVPQLLDRTGLLLDRLRAQGMEPGGIGLAVAGFLDARRDRLVYNPNLARLEQYPLVRSFASRFALPVLLEVDSNAACLGELRFGCGIGSRRFLNLCVGTGLGVGFAVDGDLVRLAYECVGDAGHVILDPQGPRCGAGCTGCAEALVSAPALELRMEQRVGRRLHTREIIERAHAGDATARSALADTGRWLGLAIASLAAVFFPDCIGISGGVAEAGEWLTGPAETAFRAAAAPFCSDRAAVRPAALGWRATLLGAAVPLIGR